jgi:hypothetical protein
MRLLEKFQATVPWVPAFRGDPCARGKSSLMLIYDLELNRDHQQCVDLLAIEDDEALDEAVGLARQVDAVEMAARGEEAHLGMVDDPDRNEVRAHLRDAVGDRVHPDRATI